MGPERRLQIGKFVGSLPPGYPSLHFLPLREAMPTPPSKQHICPHNCGCKYSTNRRRDMLRHARSEQQHRACTQGCPYYGNVVRRGTVVVVETPDSFQTKQLEAERQGVRPLPRPPTEPEPGPWILPDPIWWAIAQERRPARISRTEVSQPIRIQV